MNGFPAGRRSLLGLFVRFRRVVWLRRLGNAVTPRGTKYTANASNRGGMRSARAQAGGIFLKSSLFFLSLSVGAYAQDMKNTITISAGVAANAGSTCCGDSAPSFAASYAYRAFPHFALEAGVHAATSIGTEVRGANYDVKLDDRYIWVPFGFKGILPLRDRRVEAFIGAGGLYEKHSVGNAFTAGGLDSRDGWGGYATGGAAFAMDRSRHLWLGGSAHYFFANTDNGYTHDRWFAATLDFDLRF